MNQILIVGAGLAGISLSKQLIDLGVTTTVIDSSILPSSTAVATGMYNPIVFRRLNKTWMIDEVLPEMHAFYSSLNSLLGIESNQSIRLLKKITSTDYLEFWNKRAKNPEYRNYLKTVQDGFGEVYNAGIISCMTIMSCYKKWLDSESILINETFDYKALKLRLDGVEYGGIEYDAIVFCEGPFITNNPYFNWLPFKIAKGDWVIIQTETDLGESVINNVVNIIPLGSNRYKLSSTFEWDTESWDPTPASIDELTEAFTEVFNVPFSVIDHQSGLRPAASDRRPYLGAHPRLKKAYIFNGLGSKGVILAPYFSKHLAEHIALDKPIMADVDISRHLKRFQASTRT